MKDDLCKLAVTDPLKSLQQIYQPDITDIMYPSFASCRSVMWRARRKQMPAVPTPVAEVDLKGEWSKTIRGEWFLLHNRQHLIFVTDTNLSTLAESEKICTDGTFNSTPKLYMQLYNIQGLYQGHFVPLVFATLPDKSANTYFDMFSIIKTLNLICSIY